MLDDANLSDNEIIINAHQRLKKYIGIINQFTIYEIDMNYDQLFLDMQKIYRAYPQITAENYQKIWDIINYIKSLSNN